MKKLIFLSLVALSFSLCARSQTWTQVAGRWEYQFLKIDSAIHLPSGPTATRRAPVSGSYWLRFNTDSHAFEFSDGTKWISYTLKAPNDTSFTILGATDTTLNITCGLYPGTYTTGFYRAFLPQYVGFRVHAYMSWQLMMDLQGYCAASILMSGPWYYTFNSSTGEFVAYGTSTGYYNLMQITPY